MKRRNFLHSLGLGSLFAGLSAIPTQAAKIRRISPANPESKQQVCSMARRIYKVGDEVKLEINATPEFIKKLFQIDIKEDDGEYKFSPSKRAKYTIADNKITFTWKFQREGGYVVMLFYKDGEKQVQTKQKKKRTPAEYFPVYALDEDLYNLRAYKGDFHMHSRFSDGRHAANTMGVKCLEVGFDFQALSDHRTTKGSQLLIDEFNPLPISMRCFKGEECHKAIPHVHSIGASQCITEYIDNNKEAFEKRIEEILPTLPKDLTPLEARSVAGSEAEFEIINKFGGLSALNHPFWRMRERNIHLTKRVVQVLCERAKFDYLEIVNSSCSDDSTDLAICALFEAKDNGKDLNIFGTSDAHNKDRLGEGYTIVFAKSNEWSDVKSSILNKKNVVVESHDKKLPRLFGKMRYMQLAYFLYQFFFPLHDAICQEQANLLRACIKAKYSEESKQKLAKKSEEVKALYRTFWGA